ncbi:hypothetical protein SynA18461_00977 [Synechococcus sp. A18-46.1]|nr:hypothetical protein SynA18461_00977 [Synechococcus sp. A18-46.1]
MAITAMVCESEGLLLHNISYKQNHGFPTLNASPQVEQLQLK